MFKRPHHQRIAKVLKSFNVDFLRESQCFFGGGTAIVLQLDEYRESVDIDFLCASVEGYGKIRRSVSSDLGVLLKNDLRYIREVRADKDKISTVLEIDGEPIKVEIFKEAMMDISGSIDPEFGLLTMARDDFYIQKLFANANRGTDRHVLNRDIIDLAMMIQKWGDIPARSWSYAYNYYGDEITKGFHLATDLIHNSQHFKDCLMGLKMDAANGAAILKTLESVGSRLPLNKAHKKEQENRIQMIFEKKNENSIHESFWLHSKDAMESEPFESIDWSEIEKKVIAENISSLPYWEVANSIIELSPGATSPHRQKFIFNQIERMHGQSEKFELETNDNGAHESIPGMDRNPRPKG